MVGEYLSRALEDVRAGIKQARGEEGVVARGAAHNPKPWKKNGGGSTEFDRRILGEEEEEDRRLGS